MQALVTEAAREGLAATVFTTVGLTEAAGEEPAEAAREELGEAAPDLLAWFDLLPVAEILLDLLALLDLLVEGATELLFEGREDLVPVLLDLLDLLGEAAPELLFEGREDLVPVLLALPDLLGEAPAERLMGLVATVEICDAPREGVAATEVLVLSARD